MSQWITVGYKICWCNITLWQWPHTVYNQGTSSGGRVHGVNIHCTLTWAIYSCGVWLAHNYKCSNKTILYVKMFRTSASLMNELYTILDSIIVICVSPWRCGNIRWYQCATVNINKWQPPSDSFLTKYYTVIHQLVWNYLYYQEGQPPPHINWIF